MYPIIEKNWIHPALVELRWESRIDYGILKTQQALIHQFHKIEGIKEVRTGFHTVMVVFEKYQSPQERLAWDEFFNQSSIQMKEIESKEWKIPVCYELGKELEQLAEMKGLSVSEIIEFHSKSSYRLHFYGFLPGFMYLGGLDKRLYTDRKSIPDRLVEAGSVGIGGAQTGIYTLPSPGGWHIIGKTPLNLFDIQKSPPVHPSIGDSIRFIPIDKEAFEYLKQEVIEQRYEWEHE